MNAKTLTKYMHFKPNSLVLCVWFHLRFLCKFEPTYSEFLISTAYFTLIWKPIFKNVTCMDNILVTWMGDYLQNELTKTEVNK